MMADKWNLSRLELDEFSARSHQLAAEAIDIGAFDGQIVRSRRRLVSCASTKASGGTRRPRCFATLRPAFRPDGRIHAGNSSQISDGAARSLITTSERAAELGLRPIARFHAGAVRGDDPVMMLSAPIPATAAVLSRAGLRIGDIGIFEVNEAFAPVPLAWLAETGADPARLNPLGGAIAVGHPLGGSGAILMTRLVHRMRTRGPVTACRLCARQAAWRTRRYWNSPPEPPLATSAQVSGLVLNHFGRSEQVGRSVVACWRSARLSTSWPSWTHGGITGAAADAVHLAALAVAGGPSAAGNATQGVACSIGWAAGSSSARPTAGAA